MAYSSFAQKPVRQVHDPEASPKRPHDPGNAHVGRKHTRLPFGDRLAIDAIPLGENGVFLLARLDRFSNAWGGRRRAVRSICQLSASFSFSSHSRFPRTRPRKTALMRLAGSADP
jgi:hypothetical protein